MNFFLLIHCKSLSTLYFQSYSHGVKQLRNIFCFHYNYEIILQRKAEQHDPSCT